MTRLVRVELAKLRSTRILSVLAVVVAGLTIAMLALQLHNAGKVGAASLGTVDSLGTLLNVAGVTSPIVLVVGVIAVTSEFRHATMPTSLLTVPDRARLLVAKVLALTLVGGVVAVGGLGLELAIVVPYLTAAGVPIDLVNADLLLAVCGVLAGIPLYGIAGVGIGAVIRHQTIAVIAPLVWLAVVENLLPGYGLASVVRWLPGGATSALGRAELPGLLPLWAGGLVLAAYAAALVAAGAYRLARADV
jgi:ABC-2 type transport system permease protein